MIAGLNAPVGRHATPGRVFFNDKQIDLPPGDWRNVDNSTGIAPGIP